MMRTMFAIAAVTAITAALPAQAQLNRNAEIYPGSLQEPSQLAFDFTPIKTTDAQNRPMLIMVSAPRHGNRLPYRAIVASPATPDHYWSMSFAFDCGARKMGRVDSAKRRWHRGYKADESLPASNDFSALVAPVICDGRANVVSSNSTKAFKFARAFVDTAKR